MVNNGDDAVMLPIYGQNDVLNEVSRSSLFYLENLQTSYKLNDIPNNKAKYTKYYSLFDPVTLHTCIMK